MKIELNENMYMVAGIITSQGVKFANVGANNTPNSKFSIAIGDKQYVNCVAWNKLANKIKQGRDGDHVFVVGKLEQREYNDKIYEDLYCDCIVLTSDNNTEIKQEEEPVFMEVDMDVELPF